MLRKRNGQTFPAFLVDKLWPARCLNFKEFLPKFASVALILILILVTCARGQDRGKPTEPQSPSVLYKLDLSGQLVPLESQVVHVRRKYHAWGFAGVTLVYQVEGEKSRVRLKAGGKPEFVVQLEGRVDPLEAVQFYHFDQVDGSRAVPIVDVDFIERMSNFQLVPVTVDFNAVRYGASSFKLIPVPEMVPGEYCLLIKSTNKWAWKNPGFCFGVDEPGS